MIYCIILELLKHKFEMRMYIFFLGGGGKTICLIDKMILSSDFLRNVENATYYSSRYGWIFFNEFFDVLENEKSALFQSR